MQSFLIFIITKLVSTEQDSSYLQIEKLAIIAWGKALQSASRAW